MIIFNAKAQRREDAKGKQKLFLCDSVPLRLCVKFFGEINGKSDIQNMARR